MANGSRRRALRAAVTSSSSRKLTAALCSLCFAAWFVWASSPIDQAPRHSTGQRFHSEQSSSTHNLRVSGSENDASEHINRAVNSEEQREDALDNSEGEDGLEIKPNSDANEGESVDVASTGPTGENGPQHNEVDGVSEEPSNGQAALGEPDGARAPEKASNGQAALEPAQAQPAEVKPQAQAAASPATPAEGEDRTPARVVAPPDFGYEVTSDTIPSRGKTRAIVTMATGDEAARMALVLVQSLRDVGTADADVDVVVMLFRGGIPSKACLEGTWQREHGRTEVRCSGPQAMAEEIIDPAYVAAFRALGAKVVVMEPLVRYKHTADIPGGTSSFWGMALNKLLVFKMTQYRQVMFMDGDTMFLRNIDHLWAQPTFTSSITYACCNPNAPAIPSGGLWVLEPSMDLWARMDEQMRLGEPVFDGKTGLPVLDADGRPTYQEWRLGDMAIVRQVFSQWERNHHRDRLWPHVQDVRHGHVEGLRQLPMYKVMSPERFAEVIWDPIEGKPFKEGFQNESWTDRSFPVWHALDVMYDQCISTCQCIPWRHTPRWGNEEGAEGGYYSVHFTCMQGGTIEKPGRFEDDDSFWTAVAGAHNCYKFYYRQWYDKFQSATGGPLPGPQYSKAQPWHNATEIFFPPVTRVDV